MSFEAKNYSANEFVGAVSGIPLDNLHEDGITLEFDGDRSTASYGLGGTATLVHTSRTPAKLTVRFQADAPEIHLLLAKHKANTLFGGTSFLQQVGTNEIIQLRGCVFSNKGAMNRAVQSSDDIGAVEMIFNFGDSEEV